MQVLEPSQTALYAPRYNTDWRITVAYALMNDIQGATLVYKTTRAGVTSAFASESLNRGEPFLIVVPTNAIALDTIMNKVQLYTDAEHPRIVRIPANVECIYNQELIEEYPDLQYLPYLPLPKNCRKDCEHYDYCEVMRVYREPNWDGCVLTYHKLIALMISSSMMPNTNAEQLIDALHRAQNVIFDEVHEIQYPKSDTLEVFEERQENGHIVTRRTDLSKYEPAMQDFSYIRRAVSHFGMMLEEPDYINAELQIAAEARDDDFYKKNLSMRFRNRWHDISKTDKQDSFKTLTAAYREVIEIMKHRNEYGLNVADVLQLVNIVNIVHNETLVLYAIREKGNVSINVAALNQLHESMIKSFTMSISQHAERTIMTSATICSYNYSNLLVADVEPDKKLFGTGGDPMRNNDKMLILTENRKLHRFGRDSFYNNLTELKFKIESIADAVGSDNCAVICLNVKEATLVRKALEKDGYTVHVSYYKAPDMMGVESGKRIIIALGLAYKPANAFDAVCSSVEESQVMREEAIHCDTWQAWSRAKDPSATEPSAVIALGSRPDEVENVVRWGFGRRVNVERNGMRKNVEVEFEKENINRPDVIECPEFSDVCYKLSEHTGIPYNNFDTDVDTHRRRVYTREYMKSLAPVYVNASEPLILLHTLINRYDTFAQQRPDGRWFRQDMRITDELLEQHYRGEVTIGSYARDEDGYSRWICFDIDCHTDADGEERIRAEEYADNTMRQLCEYLGKHGVPFLLEASGSPHSYHVWLLLVNPVSVGIARAFGNDIIKLAGVNCEVYPKARKANNRNRFSTQVKLPFAINQKSGNKSMIHINGRWVAEFEPFVAGGIDISDYRPPAPVRRANTRGTKNTSSGLNGVRPCIAAAVDMQLTGGEGHYMRMAIVREYYNFGITDPTELANMFAGQADFDFEYSRYQAAYITEQDYKPWKRATLLEYCPSFLFCNSCDRIDCKKRG